jgi:hypothetical protein
MVILKRDYDFYEMPEPQQRAMVNDFFVVEEELKRLGEDLVCRYYPVRLTEQESWMNYRARQGILRVSTLWPHREYVKGKYVESGKLWFKVGCFSPDDLDLDLEWVGPPEDLRKKVTELIRDMPKDEVGYMECLEFIQSYYGGEIYR